MEIVDETYRRNQKTWISKFEVDLMLKFSSKVFVNGEKDEKRKSYFCLSKLNDQ